MSLSYVRDAILDSLYVRNGGLRLTDSSSEIEGTLRFNTATKIFEGYTGEPGPFGETWRSLLLEIASGTTLGGIKVGSNLTITSGGVLSATAVGESRLFQNVITVSYILGAADYMTIQGAIDFINDLTISNDPNKPTNNNPFKIIVSPGIYTENITLPDYVSLQGEGTGISIIRSLIGNTTISSSALVTLGQGSHLENIELQHYEGGALYSVAIYASAKFNLIIKDVKITMGTQSVLAGINVYGLYIINSSQPILNNVTVDIIKGTGNVYGMYFDPTSPIVFNSSVTIDTASNNSYGLYHQDNSNGEYRSCYVTVKGSNNNVALYNINSTPYIYGSNLIAIGDEAYGIYNESSDFQESVTSSLISFTSNPTGKDIITMPNTTGFTEGSYIIVSGAASAKNNSTFLIESIPSSTQLVLSNGLLETEAVGQSVTIKQYYTMKMDFSFIQGSTASLKNENVGGHYAILGEKSTFSGTINDTITNNGLIFFQTYRSMVVSSEGGDFKNLSDAIDSIVDNSEYRRYVIIVKSGIYNETAQIELKEYVNIIGSGRDNTIINFDTHGATQIDGASIIMASNVEISDITFQNETLTYYGADNRSVIYGNSVSNINLKKVGLNCNGGIDSSNEGFILRNSNGINTSIILNDLKVSMNENAYNKGLSLYNSNLEIQGGEILINTNAVSNKGISSEESNFNMIGTKIQITNQDGAENYGLFTENTNLLTNYFIQFFSCNITVVGDNAYAVYTCDHQSIVGGNSNLVGENYYNLDVLMKSILKLHSCWSAIMSGGNLVYYPISNNGIPMSSTNGNLFIGDEAGNLGAIGFSNTAIGVQSGSSLTTADASTFLGFQSGNNVTTGSDNTFLGTQSGKETTTGSNNTFTGFESGINNLTGTNNAAYGSASMHDGTSSNNNVVIGTQAGYNINNDDNTFVGHQSGYSSTTAIENTFVGGLSGYNNLGGSSNVLLGYNAGLLGVSSNSVVSVGHNSGYSNIVSNNTFLGTQSGYTNTTGRGQTMIGYQSGYSNTTGENNTLLGTETGYSLQSGNANLIAGARAGYSLTTGSRNIIMGSASTYGGLDAAGYSLNTGNDDVIIGSKAGKSLTNGSRNIIMGTEAGNTLLTGAENVLIGHLSGQTLLAQSGNVLIGNRAGQLNNNTTGNNIMIGDKSGANSSTSTSIFMGADAGLNSTGTYNIGIGYESLKNVSPAFGNTSTGNVFIGHHSGRNVRSGSRSVAIGGGLSTGLNGVLSSITDQNDNTAVGYLAGRIAASDGNTLIGSKTGYSMISGGLNSMLGYQAGYSTTSGQKNVFFGNDSGYNASTSSENTFIGYQSGYNTNTQSGSVAIGTQAGFRNTSTGVVSIGYRAGYSNQLASYNLFIGYEAAGNENKLLNASATSNVFIGYRAGFNAEGAASKNILIGSLSGSGLTEGQSNIMIGDESGKAIGIGSKNIFIGPDSIGSKSENVINNVFIGSGSGQENVEGNDNLFIGTNAGKNSNKSDNICFGTNSGQNMISGEKNIYIGNSAGEKNNTGQGNIVLGYFTGQGTGPSYNNSILIGLEAGRNNESDNFLSIGTEAGKSNTSGEGNINIGYQSGFSNSVGNNNINIGAQAGFNTVANNNIFIGAEAGKNNTIGTNNILLGGNAGQSNAVGINNIFMGTEAGKFTTTSNNIAIGTQAGVNNISGTRNIYLGFRSGYNSTNNNNIFLGNESGFNVTTGEGNLFMGSQAGFNTTLGGGNVFMGYQSGFNNTTGKNSMFIGFEAGYNNETGSDSLYLGYQSGYNNVSGSNNLAIGYRSQKLNTVGNQNIAIGNYSLFGNQFGDNNMVMGTNAASTGDIGDNNTIIGINSSRNIKNPGFENNIVMGFNSNFQGFASTGSILMGTNAVGEGIGGENNIVMGVNAGQSLGGAIPTITFGSGPYSNPNVNKQGYNVISVGSASVKKGQYLVIIYNNNSVYEPQVIYITQSGLTESTISANLLADINLATDTVNLLYGVNSSVVDSSLAGNSYFIVKTPKSALDTLFNTNDKITIQSLSSTNKQVFNIINTVVESTLLGTTRINIDTPLLNTYVSEDFIYLTRNKNDDIGSSDTSKASTNILMGNNAGNLMTFAAKNIAIGNDTLVNVTNEKYNTAIGTNTGYHVKSESNFLLGTKAGYYIDYANQGDGENTMIGFAAGQYAGITGIASNNVYIGNRVGQVNQGSNNIFIGSELETANSADISTATDFSNKLAIYKSDSGVPTNPLIGGDLSVNRVGILTMEPKSTLDVKGSFGKSISTITQFESSLDYQSSLTYQYPIYLDKTDTDIKLENTPSNITNLGYFNNQGICLIDSEFIIYNEKDITGLYLNNVTRGVYDTDVAHHINQTPIFNIGAIKDILNLSTNVPSTGIISLTSTDIIDAGITSIVVIDSEIIQYHGKNGGLAQVERGYQTSVQAPHLTGTNVYNISTSIVPIIETPITNNMNAITTNVSMNPTGFPASGNLIIDSEILYYPDNTPYLFNVTRATNSTLSNSHIANDPVILVSDSTSALITSNLEDGITSTTSQIQVVDMSDFSSSGYIIVEDEIIQYDNIALIDLTRGSNGTTPSLHGVDSVVRLISTSTNDLIYNFLDQAIDTIGIIGVTAMPPDTIILNNASTFPTNGQILIEDEIITYTGKTANYLENVVRGVNGTTASPHSYGANVYILDTGLTTQGTINLISSSSTILEFLSGHNDFPKEGTIQINSEIIKYYDMVLYNITRGVATTPITNHINGLTCYNFTNLIDNTLLSYTINSISLEISITNYGSFTPNGTILIGKELITYSNGIGIINVVRGIISTIPSIHNIPANIYSVPLLSLAYSTLSYNMQSEDTGIPMVNNTSYNFEGIVLIDSEIIVYYNKKTIDNVIRGAIGSSASSHSITANIYNLTGVNTISNLSYDFPSEEDALPVDDISQFSNNGKIQVQTLVSGEIVKEVINYTNKGKSLVCSERGSYGSTIVAHQLINTSAKIGVIYRITDLLSVPLKNTIEQLDESVAANGSITSYPSTGIIRVGRELMEYSNKNYGLGIETRGYRQSPITSHIGGIPVYDLPIVAEFAINPLLVAGKKIASTDLAVPVQSSLSSYPSSGYIVLGHEVINYTNKNQTLVTDTNTRGLYDSIVLSHLSGATVNSVTTLGTRNVVDSEIQTDFIPLTASHTFPSSGDLQVDREIIGYTSTNNTIVSTTRGSFNTTPSVHLTGANVRNISITGNTFSTESISAGQTTYIALDDVSSFSQSGGFALIHAADQSKSEIIQYGLKGTTIAGVTRGADQSIGISHNSGSNFTLIENSITGIQLIDDIDDSQTLIAVQIYDMMGVTLLPTSGIIALNDEILEYSSLDTSLISANRAQNGTSAASHTSDELINKIRDYDEDITLHNSSIADIAVSYPYQIEYLIRGTNNTTAASHDINDNIILLSDSHIDISNVNYIVGDVNQTDNFILLNNLDGLTELVEGDKISIDDEIMVCGNIISAINVIQITERGVDGTVPSYHYNNALVIPFNNVQIFKLSSSINSSVTTLSFIDSSPTGSMLFAGTVSSYLTVANSNDPDFALGTGDFTIEWWQYQTDNVDYPKIFSIGTVANVDVKIAFSLEPTNNGIYLTINNITNNYGALPLDIKNNWVHFAIVRVSGAISIYKNGTIFGSAWNDANSAANITSSTTAFRIGNESVITSFNAYGGYLTNFHWVKGTALYLTNFTPSTSVINPVTNTKMLLLSSSASTVSTDSSASPKTITNTSVTWSSNSFASLSGNNLQLSLPQIGTIKIGSEIIKYKTRYEQVGNFTSTQSVYENYSLNAMVRGTNSTTAATHPKTTNLGISLTRNTTTLTTKTLNGEINNTSTTITLNDVTGMATSGYILIDNEVIRYRGVSSPNLTSCLRGYGYTTKNYHITSSVVYIIDEPYQFFTSAITTTGQTYVGAWTGNMPLSILGSVGTFLIDSEIIKYYSTGGSFTSKLMDCERDTGEITYRYPPASLAAITTSSDGIVDYGSLTLSALPYGNGQYDIIATTKTTGYELNNVINSYNVSTTLSITIPDGSSTSNITVGSTTGFPTSNGKILIENEIISYTSKTSNTFVGITRGVNGTTGASHTSGLTIYLYEPNEWRTAANIFNSTSGACINGINISINSIVYLGSVYILELPVSINPSYLYVNENSIGKSNQIVIGATNENITYLNYNSINWNLLYSGSPVSGENYIPLNTSSGYRSFCYLIRSIVPNGSITYAALKQIAVFSKYPENYGTSISTYQELQDINTNTTTLSGTYTLANDITIPDGTLWTQIGNSTTPFTGTFNGNNKTIIGLSRFNASGNNKGLFGYNTGTIKNVIVNVSITMTLVAQNVGGLVGYNTGTITNCSTNGFIYTNITSSLYFGGLCGVNDSTGTITYSNSSCLVNGNNRLNIGGGVVGMNKGQINNCYATGNIIGSSNLGGFVGYNTDTVSINSNINKCYATGNVTNSTSNAGGFVGFYEYQKSGTLIQNSYATGNITSISSGRIGGFAGLIQDLVSGSQTNIDNCYSIGVIGSGSIRGGFVGESNENNGITDSFWNSTTAGVGVGIGSGSPSAGLYSKTTSELKTESTFTTVNWHLVSSTWTLVNGLYPTLLNNYDKYNKYTTAFQLNTDKNVSLVKSQLSRNITATDESISVINSSSFGLSGYLLVDSELIRYTSNTNNILGGLVRGLSLTNGVTHSGGFPIYYLADVPKKFYIDNTTYNTQSISYDLAPNNGITISGGLVTILTPSIQEFVKVDSIIGYNKNTHNADSQFLIDSEIMSSTKTIKTIPNILENRMKISSQTTIGSTNFKILMDPNGLYVYIYSSVNLSKVLLSNNSVTSVTNIAGVGFTLFSAIIDSSGTYAYFGTSASSNPKIIKVDLSTLTSVGSLTIATSFNHLVYAVIDKHNEYGYFASAASTGIIYKINLSNLSLISSTSSPVVGSISSAIIDQYDQYIYFSASSFPTQIIKYTTSSGAVTSLTTIASIDFISCGTIDKNNEYIYFGSSSAGRITKINLSTFTITDVLELPSKSVYNIGYAVLTFGVIDNNSKYAYFGVGSSTGSIIKVNLDTFTIDEIYSVTNSAINSGVIDILSQNLYINSGTNILYKVNISYTPTSSTDSAGIFYNLAGNSLDNTSDVIKLLNSLNISGSGTFKCGAIDQFGQFGYFGTGDSPGKVYKINMKTFTVVGSPIIAPVGTNNFVSAVLDYDTLYLGTELASAARFVKITVSSFLSITATYTSNAATLAIRSCDVLNDGDILLGGTTAATPIRFYKLNSSLVLVGSIVTYAYTGGGSARTTSTLADYTYVYFGLNIVIVTPSASTITNVVRYTTSLATPVTLILTGSKSSNCGALDSNSTYLYYGSSTGEEVYRVATSSFGSGSVTPTKLILGSGNASASLDVAVIDTANKYAYFTSNSTTVSKVYQVDLTTFTQTYVINLGANMSLISGFIDPYEKLAYFATSQSSSTILKMGVNYLNNLDFLYDLDSAIPITSITYNGTTLGSSTITPTSADNVLQFNPSGGYVTLLYYEYTAGDTVYANNPINTIIVKYQSISSVGVLQNLSVVSYQNASTTITFTKMAYLRGSDNLVDPYASGLLSIGQNQISASNSLVPISGTLAKVYADTTLINSDRTGKIMHQYIQPTITHSNVYRHLRDTTIANHSSGSNIIRVTSTSQDYLRNSLDNSSGTIPITNGYIYGYSGYLLIDSEIISYNNGYGLNFTRGAYNTTPNYHYNTGSYYCYELGASTTLRTSVDSTTQNIPLTSITGLTSGNKYLITSASGLDNPEVLSGGSLNNTIDSITRNLYSTGDNSYTNTGSNIRVYSLQSITTPSTLRTDMTNSSKYVSLLGSGSSYPSEFNNTNYILIDQELIPITTRYSFDGIASNRNKYSTQTARAGYKSTASAVTVNGYSTLRQNITNQQLFFPLTNASSYPSSGRVIIGGEWIEYNSKNSFDFTIGDRGQYTTIPADYSANVDIPLLLINTPASHSTIENPMTNTTKVISIADLNTNYTNNGIVLIDTEIIKINSKNTFDTIIRNRYLTETVSSTNLNFNIINTSVVTGSPENTIRDPCLIGIDSSCIQFEFADDMLYGVTGVGLLDGEFFTWESKNSLDGLTRGVDGTSDLYHSINTGVNIVAEIGSYPLDVDGNIIIYSTTLLADKVLLSDETSGIKILDSQDVTTFPPSGTIVIGTEKILYQSNKSLANITRNTNATTSASYLMNTNIYLIDTTVNTSIVNTTLASSIVSGSDQITLISASGFSSAGTIIINSEIINYTGILGSTLTGCTRGRYLTIAATHLAGATIYRVPLQNVVRTTIIQNMSDDDLIVGVTNTTGYQTQGTVLIGSEIITYQSKNALSKITHGHDSTIARGYVDGTSLEFTNILLSDEESTVLIDTSSGNVVVDLPSAIDIKGRIYTVKKISAANNVLIQPFGTQLIDLQLSLSISQNLAFVAIQSDGTNWKLILNSQYDSLGSAAQAQSNSITAANLYTDNAIASALNDLATGITSSDFISEGITNLYFTDSRVVTAVQNNITTDDITEGLTNLYFTDERAVLAMTGLYDPIGSATTAQTNAISIAGTNAVNTIVAGAPSTMNTLNKIATALNNDSSFYDTIINLLAEKLNITTAFSLLPPIGTIVSYGGSSAPSKWLLCQGQSLSTTTYSALFTAIGYTYGGSGASFTLPDCRGRTLIAPDASAGIVTAFNTLGAKSGAQNHSLDVGEMPRHTHKVAQYFSAGDNSLGLVTNANYNDGGGNTTYGISDFGQINDGGFNMSRTSYTGGSGTFIDQSIDVSNNPASAHNNMQPYIVVNYIIYTNV